MQHLNFLIFSENCWKKARWKFEGSKQVRKVEGEKVQILSSTQILICNPGAAPAAAVAGIERRGRAGAARAVFRRGHMRGLGEFGKAAEAEQDDDDFWAKPRGTGFAY